MNKKELAHKIPFEFKRSVFFFLLSLCCMNVLFYAGVMRMLISRKTKFFKHRQIKLEIKIFYITQKKKDFCCLNFCVRNFVKRNFLCEINCYDFLSPSVINGQLLINIFGLWLGIWTSMSF